MYLLQISRVPVIFLLSIPLAVVAPTLATYSWGLIAVAGLVLDRFATAGELQQL